MIDLFQAQPVFAYSAIILCGLTLASGLGNLLFLIPKIVGAESQRAITKRGACDICEAPLSLIERLPVVAFIAAHGRCRTCGSQINPVYILVELGTVAILVSVYAIIGITLNGAATAFLLCSLLVLALTDIRDRLLPHIVTIPLIVIGISVCFIGEWNISFAESFFSACLCFGYLKSLEVFYAWRDNILGIGGGDIMMAAAIGAWFGTSGVTIIVLAYIGFLIFRKLTSCRTTKVPAGTCFALVASLALVVPI